MGTPFTISQRIFRLHWGVVFITLCLCILGFAMLYSAAGGKIYPWVQAQLMRFIPAFFLMFIIAVFPVGWVLRLSYPAYIIGVGLLIWVEIAGHRGMGAERWIQLGSVTLQPAEFMKVALIMALARYFHSLHPDNIRQFVMLIPPLILIALPAMLILRQPNLGTTGIIILISVAILFMAGVQWRYFIGGAAAILMAGPAIWYGAMHDYQKQRVLTFLDPSQDPLGAGYNITQSIIAIGSGSVWGKGFTEGSQGQLDFLPEKQTDFIFTMLAEELGFAGGTLLLLLYSALLFYGMRIAFMSRHTYGALLACGVVAMLFIHIVINIAMVMGLFPVVGVPLPFLSYGGSFMIATLGAIGLLLHAHVNKDKLVERSLRLG